jgi:hypothetical protein
MKKRLDPNHDQGKCWFCKSRPGTNGSARVVSLYKVVGRSFTKTQYQTAKVEIPRCRVCQVKHRFQASYLIITSIVGMVGFVGLVFWISLEAAWAKFMFLTGGLLWITLLLLARKSVPRDTGWFANVKEFHPIRARIEDGWEIGDGPVS